MSQVRMLWTDAHVTRLTLSEDMIVAVFRFHTRRIKSSISSFRKLKPRSRRLVEQHSRSLPLPEGSTTHRRFLPARSARNLAYLSVKSCRMF